MKGLAFVVAIAAVLAAPLPAQGQGRTTDTIPDEYKPPPGMCRIWIKDVPPAQQPAPTDCPTAIRRKPQNARVIFGEALKNLEPPKDPPKKGKKPEDEEAPRRLPVDVRRPPPPNGRGKPPGR